MLPTTPGGQVGEPRRRGRQSQFGQRGPRAAPHRGELAAALVDRAREQRLFLGKQPHPGDVAEALRRRDRRRQYLLDHSGLDPAPGATAAVYAGRAGRPVRRG
jgi:hypothetical protein